MKYQLFRKRSKALSIKEQITASKIAHLKKHGTSVPVPGVGVDGSNLIEVIGPYCNGSRGRVLRVEDPKNKPCLWLVSLLDQGLARIDGSRLRVVMEKSGPIKYKDYKTGNWDYLNIVKPKVHHGD